MKICVIHILGEQEKTNNIYNIVFFFKKENIKYALSAFCDIVFFVEKEF
jgi:hypothetical protein